MKRFTFMLLLFFALKSTSFAQNQVRDTHPRASITVIDYQTGNQVAASGDQAILFKDAFIDLSLASKTSRSILNTTAPGVRRVFVTQADPQLNGNAFQLDMQNTDRGQTSIIMTFIYSVDQNQLYFYDPNQQNYVPETVEGQNVSNLNECLTFGKFHQVPAGYHANAQAGNTQTDVDDAAYSGPVDTEVAAPEPPPALPEYVQPECPSDGYLWQPGYWAYTRDTNKGYYWVPGTWVAPPREGLLWTPPFWGYEGARYLFHIGYWGNSVGFYGGVNYGYGYQGAGYVGGEWREHHFRYNTAVVRVNVVNVHNTYINKVVINNVTVNHYSYNGPGGAKEKPTSREIEFMHEKHIMPTAEQNHNQWAARKNPQQFAANNGGKPAEVALKKAPDAPVGGSGANGSKKMPNGKLQGNGGLGTGQPVVGGRAPINVGVANRARKLPNNGAPGTETGTKPGVPGNGANKQTPQGGALTNPGAPATTPATATPGGKPGNAPQKPAEDGGLKGAPAPAVNAPVTPQTPAAAGNHKPANPGIPGTQTNPNKPGAPATGTAPGKPGNVPQKPNTNGGLKPAPGTTGNTPAGPAQRPKPQNQTPAGLQQKPQTPAPVIHPKPQKPAPAKPDTSKHKKS